jgi:hypothetical protein
MSEFNAVDPQRDEHLVRHLSETLSAFQRALHEAVEAGLKVSVTVETMHKVGEHYPEPLVEVAAERVTKLL